MWEWKKAEQGTERERVGEAKNSSRHVCLNLFSICCRKFHAEWGHKNHTSHSVRHNCDRWLIKTVLCKYEETNRNTLRTPPCNGVWYNLQQHGCILFDWFLVGSGRAEGTSLIFFFFFKTLPAPPFQVTFSHFGTWEHRLKFKAGKSPERFLFNKDLNNFKA